MLSSVMDSGLNGIFALNLKAGCTSVYFNDPSQKIITVLRDSDNQALRDKSVCFF